MTFERGKPCSGPSPVTKRLCGTIVFFIGVLCVFGGYLLYRMSQNDVKSNDIVPFNLTVAAVNLYKKARRISPKAVHHSDPQKVTARLLHIFNCTQAECGTISNYNVAEFIKRSINLKVIKLLQSVNNANMYLHSLR